MEPPDHQGRAAQPDLESGPNRSTGRRSQPARQPRPPWTGPFQERVERLRAVRSASTALPTTATMTTTGSVPATLIARVVPAGFARAASLRAEHSHRQE